MVRATNEEPVRHVGGGARLFVCVRDQEEDPLARKGEGAFDVRTQRARRAKRSGSRISTLLPSSRSQPRWAKSAKALLTVSRDAPTSCAISSCVRSCVTRSNPEIGRASCRERV